MTSTGGKIWHTHYRVREATAAPQVPGLSPALIAAAEAAAVGQPHWTGLPNAEFLPRKISIFKETKAGSFPAFSFCRLRRKISYKKQQCNNTGLLLIGSTPSGVNRRTAGARLSLFKPPPAGLFSWKAPVKRYCTCSRRIRPARGDRRTAGAR